MKFNLLVWRFFTVLKFLQFTDQKNVLKYNLYCLLVYKDIVLFYYCYFDCFQTQFISCNFFNFRHSHETGSHVSKPAQSRKHRRRRRRSFDCKFFYCNKVILKVIECFFKYFCIKIVTMGLAKRIIEQCVVTSIRNYYSTANLTTADFKLICVYACCLTLH